MKAKATSLRQVRVRALRRELILEAATRVFAARGLSGSTIRDIAAEAGYSAASIYVYFSNQEELYAAVLEQALRSLLDDFQQLAEAAPIQVQLEAIAEAYIARFGKDDALFELGFYMTDAKRRGLSPALDAQLNKLLSAATASISRRIALAVSRGELGDTDADEAASCLFATLCGVLLVTRPGRRRVKGISAESMARRMISIFVLGLKGGATVRKRRRGANS